MGRGCRRQPHPVNAPVALVLLGVVRLRNKERARVRRIRRGLQGQCRKLLQTYVQQACSGFQDLGGVDGGDERQIAPSGVSEAGNGAPGVGCGCGGDGAGNPGGAMEIMTSPGFASEPRALASLSPARSQEQPLGCTPAVSTGPSTGGSSAIRPKASSSNGDWYPSAGDQNRCRWHHCDRGAARPAHRSPQSPGKPVVGQADSSHPARVAGLGVGGPAQLRDRDDATGRSRRPSPTLKGRRTLRCGIQLPPRNGCRSRARRDERRRRTRRR